MNPLRRHLAAVVERLEDRLSHYDLHQARYGILDDLTTHPLERAPERVRRPAVRPSPREPT